MLQFNDQRWIVGDCKLSVFFPLYPLTLPAAWWNFEAAACPLQVSGLKGDWSNADLRLSVHPIFLAVKHWRELENLELKLDSHWQDAHEFVNEDGEVQCTEIEARWWPDRSINLARYWIGDELSLRFGSWDGQRFICELEARMEREERFYADPDGQKASDSGADKLLLMAEASIESCEVEVPSHVPEPIEWARRKMTNELGMRNFRASSVRRVGQISDDEAPAGSGSYKVVFDLELHG